MSNATIDLDKILSPEQRQELAKQVWEENQEQIKTNIRKALHHELQSDIVHRTRKLIGEELMAMVQAVLAERLPTIEKELNRMVHYLTNFGDVVPSMVSEAVKEYFELFTESSSHRIAAAIKSGVNKALNAGEQRYFANRADRQRGQKDQTE
jgi:hypothetical protein